MKKYLFLSLMTATFLMTGCAQKEEGYFTSHDTFKQDDTNNFIIANDFVEFADDFYNPTTTKFVIDPLDKDSQFLKVFESRLREKGYGVGYANMNESAWLAWKITPIDNDTISVTYHIQDSKYTKMYKLSHGKYAPVGAFTIFNQKPSLNNPEPVYAPQEPIIKVVEVVKEIPPNDVWETFVSQNSYLHIRQNPTIKSKVVGTLKKGTKLEQDSSFDDKKWVKINQMDGYVAKRYLKYIHPKNEGDIVYEPRK
jgi:hypothetical protein